MEALKESPQALMEKKLEGISDYGDKLKTLEDELENLEKAERSGESVDSEYRDYLEKMRKEWRDARLENI